MRTIRLFRSALRWVGCLTLVAGWLPQCVLAQGVVRQDITWTGAAGPALALDTPHAFGATASSGLSVAVWVEFGPAVLVDGKLTITGPGRVQVTAEQPGDTTYAAVRESRYFNGRQAVVSRVGRYDFTGSAQGVELVGDLAYVALESRWVGQSQVGAGLEILNVSDPTQPVRVGRLNATTWGGLIVRVVGDFAYLISNSTTVSGTTTSALRIIDVSDPASPVQRGVVNLGRDLESARGLTVQGDFAYIASNEGGFQVVDIRNPVQPVRVGGLKTLGWSLTPEVVGHTGYLADRHAGLQVLDVSDPSRVVRVGGYQPERGVSGVVVAGQLAYLAGPPSLEVVDISQPSRPVRLGAARVRDSVSMDSFGNQLAVADSLAFVLTFTGFEIVDVTEPARPASLGFEELKWPRGIDARGAWVHVISQEGHLQIYEARRADSQALVWTGAGGPLLDLDMPHPLQATASSGLPVSFRVESGPGTILDGHLTLTGPGEVVVTAEQAGDATFAPVRETRTYNVRQMVLTELGSIAARNSTADVRVVGDLAYLAESTAGLQIVDVSNPRFPVRVGMFATGGVASGVEVVGDRAYLAVGTAGLQILDVVDPAAPVGLGAFSTDGAALKVRVVGHLAYVAANTARLQILDVSDPAQPVRRSTASHSGSALDVQVVASLAYVAAGTLGLHILDVSDPDAPVRLGGLTGLGEVTAVQVVGNRAYLAAGTTGLQVLDVTDPAAPIRLGGLDLLRPEVPGAFPWQPAQAFANAVRVVDGMAYVTTERAGLQVVDVRDPAQPVRLGVLDTGNLAVGVGDADGLVYLADGTAGLRVVEVRIGHPQHLVWPDLAPVLTPGTTQVVEVGSGSGMPVVLRVETGPATITDGRLTVTGPGLVVVTAEQAGNDRHLPVRETRIFNVAEPRWDRLSLTEATGEAMDVHVVGSRAYVIESGVWENTQMTGGGLRVLDVSDPHRPVTLGRLGLDGQGQQVVVAGHLAWVAAGSAGLQVVDVSNPAAMTLVGGLNLGETRSVQVVGHLAYVVAGSSLHVLDLSHPEQPVQIGGVTTGTTLNQGTVVGRYAYVVGGTAARSSLHLIDVGEPTSPQRVGEVLLPGRAVGIRVVDHVAYVTSWGRFDPVMGSTGGGLTLVDVRDPSNPVVRGRALPGALSSSVDVMGNLAFLTDLSSDGLHLLDLSMPGQPVVLGALPGASGARRVQVAGGVVHLAAGYSGYQILHLDLGLPQSLHWSGIQGALPALGTPYPVGVTASSGLPVSLRVVSGPATWTDGWLTAHGPGLIQVVAEQPGDAVFLPVRDLRGFGGPQGDFSLAGEMHTGGGARSVRVVGNLAYVLDEGTWNYSNPDFARLEDGGLRIVDVSHPARPTLVGELRMTGRMEELLVKGNRAYVVDTGTDTAQGIVNAGLRIVDITDPASPALLGRVLLDEAKSLSIDGDLAYVTGWSETKVIDVSDPASLVVVATWPRGGHRIRVVSGRAYVIHAQQLEVLDVSDPTQPVRLGARGLPSYGSDVQISGNLAYVTSNTGSDFDSRVYFQVFDISDAAQPRFVSEVSLQGGAGDWRIRLFGGLAYVAGVEAQLAQGIVHVLDLSQPDQPQLLGGLRSAGYAYDMDLGPGIACVATGRGLQVHLVNFRAPQPLRLELPELLPFPGTPLAAPASNPGGLPLAFTVISGPARMEDQQLIITGLGPVTLRADQPGDDRHLPASIEWTFSVHPPTPRLQANGTQLELAWPIGLPGLVLLHRETLSPETPWRDLTVPTVEFEGEVRALLEALAPTGFFQLVHP